jgi:hypothetical protein
MTFLSNVPGAAGFGGASIVPGATAIGGLSSVPGLIGSAAFGGFTDLGSDFCAGSPFCDSGSAE